MIRDYECRGTKTVVTFGRYVPITIVRNRGLATETRQEVRAGGDIHSKILLHTDVTVNRGDEIDAEVLDEPRVVDEVQPVVLGDSVSHYEVIVVPLSVYQESHMAAEQEWSAPRFSSKLIAVLTDTLDKVLEECEVGLERFVKAYDLPGLAEDQDGVLVTSTESFVEDLREYEPAQLSRLIHAMTSECQGPNPVFFTMKRGFRVSPLIRLKKQLAAEGYRIENLDAQVASSEASNTQHEVHAAMPDIFISHSSKDELLARALVELFKAAFSLRPDRIRATSIDGHRLPAGTDENQLREETVEAKLLVGIITEVSIESAYVLFELGARWGVDRPMFPILGAGATPKVLRGPLARKNALSCDSRAQVQQIISDAASILGIEANRPESYDACVETAISSSNSLKEERSSNP